MSKFKNFNLVSAFTCASLLSTSVTYAQNHQQNAQPPQALLKEVKSGRKPASELKYRQAGVPVFEFVKKQDGKNVRVKEIPQLDIGEEKVVAAKPVEFAPVSQKSLKLKNFQSVKSPDLVKIDPELLKVGVPNAPRAFASPIHSSVPIVNPIHIVSTPALIDPQYEAINLVEIKPDEYKMIQALIFLEYQKKNDLAMALFIELMDHPEFKYQATYHYAQTALESRLYSEFREKMILVTKESKNEILRKMATESLVQNIKHLEISDIGLIDPIAEAQNIDTSSNVAYLIKKAKFEMEKGNLSEVETTLSLIPQNAPEYAEGNLLKAIFNYRKGQLDTALQDLTFVWPTIEAKKTDQIRNLIALTLGRLYFQKGDFTNAFKFYQVVDKRSGEWLQSMVEQAWTQVMAGDNVGAAGNMFAMHTEFFSKAYSPDSYLIRSVGYLNLCQYGDGMAILEDFKSRYEAIHKTLLSFQQVNKDPIKYYDLVKTWMTNPKVESVDGLSKAVIIELAKHPNYTKPQQQINNYEDENSRFNRITIDLIRKEKQARLEMLKTRNALNAAKRAKQKNVKTITELEQKYLAVGVEHVIFSKARENMRKMREQALARLNKEKSALIVKAANNLKSRFDLFASTLDHLIDQRDVLSYEIYSGAGEHIRYQMAGGEVKAEGGRAIASAKHNYNWKHKGEVWFDEIGHYRSSLKNVCPKNETE